MRRALQSLLVSGALATTPVVAQDLDITVTNLTHATYFTPLLIAAHPSGTHVFQAGTAASTNLQAMAEGGDISGLSSDLDAIGADQVEDPAGGFLAPGAGTSTDLITAAANDRLSLVGMPLPTNDGFVGLDGLELPDAAGTYTYTVDAYDAGTEANTETAATVPGPAAGGEGFNAARDDTGRVSGHPGVVTADDGLATLALGEAHRFDRAVARLKVTRLQ